MEQVHKPIFDGRFDGRAAYKVQWRGKADRTRQASTRFPEEIRLALVTLERGDEASVWLSKRDLWHNDFALPPTATITPLADTTVPPHIFKVQFQHTLGYINKAYDPTPYNKHNALESI